MKELINKNGKSYGIIGEKTGIGDIRVGDIVAFLSRGAVHTSVMAKDYENDIYFPMGWKYHERNSSDVTDTLKTIISHRDVDDHTLEIVKRSVFSVREVKAMTLREVQEALGYPVQIVEGD